MTGETHEWLIRRLASILVTVRTIESLPHRICEAGRQMLSADGAALTLATAEGARLQVYASDELTMQLEDLQDVVEQGPSIDALRSGVVQIAAFAAEGDGKWPMMHEHGARLGFTGTLLSVPLVVDDRVIGALSAHRQRPEAPEDRDVGTFLGVALATALLQDPELAAANDACSASWPSKAQINQATGMVVAQVGVLPEDALALLKGHAFAQNTTLLEVARHVIERTINFRQFTIEGD